jgi:hypothetical protein
MAKITACIAFVATAAFVAPILTAHAARGANVCLRQWR